MPVPSPLSSPTPTLRPSFYPAPIPTQQSSSELPGTPIVPSVQPTSDFEIIPLPIPSVTPRPIPIPGIPTDVLDNELTVVYPPEQILRQDQLNELSFDAGEMKRFFLPTGSGISKVYIYSNSESSGDIQVSQHAMNFVTAQDFASTNVSNCSFPHNAKCVLVSNTVTAQELQVTASSGGVISIDTQDGKWSRISSAQDTCRGTSYSGVSSYKFSYTPFSGNQTSNPCNPLYAHKPYENADGAPCETRTPVPPETVEEGSEVYTSWQFTNTSQDIVFVQEVEHSSTSGRLSINGLPEEICRLAVYAYNGNSLVRGLPSKLPQYRAICPNGTDSITVPFFMPNFYSGFITEEWKLSAYLIKSDGTVVKAAANEVQGGGVLKKTFHVTNEKPQICQVGSQAKILDIEGSSHGAAVDKGKWTGQPKTILINNPNATNKYKGYYVLDSDLENRLYITGENFGHSGIVTFSSQVRSDGSRQEVIPKNVVWERGKIQVAAQVPLDFTKNEMMIIRFTPEDGVPFQTSPLKVIAAFKGRGYGQCTWYAAHMRKSRGLAITDTAYTDPNIKIIDYTYVPRQWDQLFQGNNEHTSIILRVGEPTSSIDPQSGHTLISYPVTIGEMNGRLTEEVDPEYSTDFVVDVTVGEIKQYLRSHVKSPATRYFR